MFGHRYFGARHYGPRYFGPALAEAAAEAATVGGYSDRHVPGWPIWQPAYVPPPEETPERPAVQVETVSVLTEDAEYEYFDPVYVTRRRARRKREEELLLLRARRTIH